MNSERFESMMRTFETAHDHAVLPGIHMVARIDGRSFTRLTKELHGFETPFDERFRDHMIATTGHLMRCGFQVIYGYTQSDEISLLFHRDTNVFGRGLRKYNSVLAGEASAKFSLLLGDVGAFDCRISQLTSIARVCDYFRWRAEDAARNALSAHCYWTLRREGRTMAEATGILHGLTTTAKNELLFERGINYNDLPAWQKRGVGLLWEERRLPAGDGRPEALRNGIRAEMELPTRESYGAFIERLVASSLEREEVDHRM